MPLKSRSERHAQSTTTRQEKLKRALAKKLHAVTNDQLESSIALDTVERPDEKAEDINSIDLPKLSSRDLSRWLQYCTGMHSFALVRLAEAENKLQVVSSLHASKRAEYLAIYQGMYDAKWKLDAEVDKEPDVVMLDSQLKEISAVKTLVKAHVQVWEARSAMFSREVSRRSSEKQQGI